MLFSNDNLETLESIKKILDVNTNIRSKERLNGKIGYTLAIGVWRDVKRIANILLTRCIVKHDRLQQCLDFIEAHNYREGKYTKREIRFIREHSNMTASEIAKILKRSVGSIRTMRRKGNYNLPFSGDPGQIGPQIREKLKRTGR